MVGPQFRALHIRSKLGWRLVHEDRFVFYSEDTPRHGNVPYFKLSVGDRAIPWTEEGFRTHGYWRAVHLLAAEAWRETAEIPRKLPLAA